MRNWMTLVAAALLALLLAVPATSLPYTGTLSLGVGTLPPFLVPGDGDGVSTSTDVEIGPGANFTTSLAVPVTNMTPGGMVTFPAFPIVNLALTGPAGLTEGDWSAGNAPAGGFGGDSPLAGNAKIGLFGPPPFAFLTVPLSAIGVEGATAMVSSPLGVSITVFGEGWTTGMVTVVGTTGPFLGQILAQATGTDQRTPNGQGTIVLVTPALSRTNVGGSENLPLLTTITLNFVPEPGTLMLLGSGVAGLALLGRRRKETV